ncbi:MAG: hypothetical protein GY699_03805 [Desulfobacteraceae bacterium]|nr:hypothetical protein [Desulfobacteraceae bacterium]
MARLKRFKLKLCLIYTLTILLILSASAWALAPINIFPSESYGSSSLKVNKVKKIIKKKFNLNEAQVHKANVRVIYDNSGDVDYLVVYLLSSTSYSVETFRVNLTGNYQVTDIVYNYQDTAETMAQEYDASYASCPDTSVDMVFSTCETGIETAVSAINYASNVAFSSGYNVKTLMGSEESTSAIQNWLSCPNLILLGRIGHGDPSSIMVDNGTVSSSYFNGLSSTALNDKVLFFNSCDVHNSPLEPAILSAGVQKYIGGDTALYIGPSEEVFKCWVQRVVGDDNSISTSLELCEQDDAGLYGISGNGSEYLSDGGGTTPPPPTPTPTPPPNDDTLTNGQTVWLGAAKDQWVHYQITVPQGASNFTVQISGGSGDADLYTRFDAEPTTSSYDCRPYQNGNNETCSDSSPSAGTWYIGIRAYSAFSAVSLTAEYD